MLAEGRDLLALKRSVRRVEAEPIGSTRPDSVHRRWDFGDVPRAAVVQRRGLRFTVYPTLRDHGDGVELAEAGTCADAEESLRPAVLRLAMLALPEQFKYARKRFADDRDLVLLGQGMNTARPMPESLAERAFSECFLGERRAVAAHGGSSSRRCSIVTAAASAKSSIACWRTRARHCASCATCGRSWQRSTVRRSSHCRRTRARSCRRCVPADFPTGVPAVLWPHLPRYLKALARRLDKAPGNQKRDAELMARVAPGDARARTAERAAA